MLQAVSSSSLQVSSTHEAPFQRYLMLFVKGCLERFDRTNRTFSGLRFPLNKFNSLLESCTLASKVDYDKNVFSGFVNRLEVPTGSCFTVQADLHGDLASLICLLESLQKEGFLDENYLPKEGNYLVFLGDYMDRGLYNLEVLMTLVLLKQGSERVILLRGNHEYVDGHALYLNPHSEFYDRNFATYLASPENKTRLEALYETFPLALYVTPIAAKPEYFIFCHGLPSYHFDPELHYGAPPCQLVPRKIALSERVKKLPCMALKDLVAEDGRGEESEPLFLMGRIRDITNLRSLHLNRNDIRSVLRAAAEKISLILRGHDHVFRWEITVENKVIEPVALTLPVSMGGALRESSSGENLPLALRFALQAPLEETAFQVLRTEIFESMNTELMPDKFYLAKPKPDSRNF